MKNTASTLIKELTDYAPTLLFVAMVLAFGYMGVMQYKYYGDIFSTSMPELAGFLGIGSAIIMQICRLASGLASAYHFKNGKPMTGILALAFSLALSAVEHNEAASMAAHWAAASTTLLDPSVVVKNEKGFLLLLRFVVWVAAALELSLAISLLKAGDNDDDENDIELQEQLQELINEVNRQQAIIEQQQSSLANNGSKKKKKKHKPQTAVPNGQDPGLNGVGK